LFRIGTSGYSYQDWRGVFYPKVLEPSLFLNYYAKYFDTVEIDSTYYRIPPPGMFEALSRKLPSNFKFSVKTPSTFTHEREKYGGTLEPFRRCLSPLVKKGLLGCLLAQFPFSFKRDEDSLQFIAKMNEDLEGLAPVCVEFRNVDWQKDEVYSFLKQRGICYVNVDLPKLSGLPRSSSTCTSEEISYFRFHGRNAKAWWNPPQPHERYNYEYSKDELEEWAPRINEVQPQVKETYLLFNNHYGGKSARAAFMMKKILGIEVVHEPPQLNLKQQVLLDE
jgi:uncharacterized protein YecE (DUF72 family)